MRPFHMSQHPIVIPNDKVLSFFLAQLYPNHNIYSWLDSSDERQYCSPHINLPVCTVTRSKFHVYPEYHTDLDNLNFVSSRTIYSLTFSPAILFLEANCSPLLPIHVKLSFSNMAFLVYIN